MTNICKPHTALSQSYLSKKRKRSRKRILFLLGNVLAGQAKFYLNVSWGAKLYCFFLLERCDDWVFDGYYWINIIQYSNASEMGYLFESVYRRIFGLIWASVNEESHEWRPILERFIWRFFCFLLIKLQSCWTIIEFLSCIWRCKGFLSIIIVVIDAFRTWATLKSLLHCSICLSPSSIEISVESKFYILSGELIILMH